jgi:hypothetical protein
VGAQRTEGLRKSEPNGCDLATSLTYADEGEDMLNRIVIGDESWVHHYQPVQSMLHCNGNI